MAPSSLYFAVYSGNISTIRKYIKSKQDDGRRVDWNTPNVGVNNDWTPLMLAVFRGYKDIVRELLTHTRSGLRVEAYSERTFKTPLIMAASKGRTRCAELLLRANHDKSHIDWQNRSERDTAFLLAIRRRNLATASAILGYDPDMSLRNANRDGPLHFAIKRRNILLVKRILDGRGGREAAKQKNSEGNTPLHLAVLSRVDILVQEVLDAGADKNDTNVWRQTALFVANLIGNPTAAWIIQSH